jgi:signal transduction histidine kinase
MTTARATHYAMAIAAVLAAIALRRLLDPIIADSFPFATLFLAVLVSAWVGGLRPALLATAIGAMGAAFLMSGPRQTELFATAIGRWGLLLYAMVALAIAWFGGAMHGAKERAEKAERALREQDDLKNRFIATLAHEVKNPLAAIRMAVALLEKRGLADEMQRPVDVIDRQSRRIERLAEDLMDASRIALGKIELRKHVCDVREIVARSIESTSPDVSARQHTLRHEMPDEPIAVEADPMRLQQVFGNLLSNAARYTDPGGQITVATRRGGDSVTVHISDTGIGLDAAHAAFIFEPFVQVGDEARGGLGLGLALVRNLVEMHGGNVEARSAGMGKGSEFIVRLPVASAPIDCPN